MVDSIGKFSVGKSKIVGKRRTIFLRRTIRKAEIWRDSARMNLFQQRKRYQQKVESNKALMTAKKAGRLPNLNPSSKLNDVGFKPKSLHRFTANHSTVPSKPKYSIVKPAKRIYGNRWRILEQQKSLESQKQNVFVKSKKKGDN